MSEAIKQCESLIRSIDAGETQVECLNPEDADWQHINIRFRSDDGSTIAVFMDGGGWDYVDSITLPDGLTVEYEELLGSDFLKHYMPSGPVEMSRWNWPRD